MDIPDMVCYAVSAGISRRYGRKNMKKPYEELELEVIRFGAEDVITASADETTGDITGRNGGTAATTITDTTAADGTTAGSVPGDGGGPN